MQDNLGLHNFSSEIVKEEGKKVLFHQWFTNAAHCRKVVGADSDSNSGPPLHQCAKSHQCLTNFDQ